MKNKLWFFSTIVLSALAISAFSPITFAQAGILTGQSDVMPIPIQPAPAASLIPAEPGLPSRTIEDINSILKASEKRALSGDNFSKELYERPFTSQEMAYLPDTDIQSAAISSDELFYYFTIKLAGLNAVTNQLGALYGIEIDVDKDGRGDFLFTASSPTKGWSASESKAFADANKDVGGKTPLRADSSTQFKSDGYERVLASSSSVFSRLDPSSEATVQIAVSKEMLGDATQFLWGAWADSGLRNLRELDYNDQFSATEAGSPIKSDKRYPVKALFAVDNTCRVPYGFTTKTILPGMCSVAVTTPEKPSTPRLPGTNPIG